MSDEQPWRDAETLERLYWEEERSPYEIGPMLGCSYRTIYTWMERLDIPRRDVGESRVLAGRDSVPKFETRDTGYERWYNYYRGKKYEVLHHRLLAVAEYGFDAVVDNHVHHDNGVPWDNRPENIELLSPEEHMRLHFEERDDIGPEIGLIAQHGAEAVLGPDEQYGSKAAAEEARQRGGGD